MRIFRPSEVVPVVFNSNPDMVHRRVVSLADGGPKSIDIGYNKYKSGNVYNGPYAYNKDEIGYFFDGAFKGKNLSADFVCEPGSFIFRPAAAVTDFFRITRDITNICAFVPARPDASSHRLSPEQFPHWDGRPETRFVPIVIHYSKVAPTPFPGIDDQSGITFREIFSKTRHNSNFMDASHIAVEHGTTLRPLSSKADELWWLEGGELFVISETGEQTVKANECLCLSPADAGAKIVARDQSVIITFCAEPR